MDNNGLPDFLDFEGVAYDDLFAKGAGFYAHSGLRAVTNVMDDNAFSNNAVENFTANNSGDAGLYERFNADVIATEAENKRWGRLNPCPALFC